MTDPLRAALEAARLHVADGHSCDDTRGDCSDHMERVYRAALAADAARPGLDVEALAEAFRRVPVAVMGASQTYAVEAAKAIAAEYTRLTEGRP